MTNKNNFKFCGRNNEHYNQVDIELKDNNIILHCWTDGYSYGHGYGARFCAGGNNYIFPSDIEPTYENIIHFIINNTWIGNNIEDIVDKEEYEIFINKSLKTINKSIGEVCMIDLNKDKYYKGYFETNENNPTVKLLYRFDTEKQFKTVKELSDNIREQAKNNVNKWIEMNNSSYELLKNQLIYLLNNTFKQFMTNKKLGRYKGEIKQYINTDKALTMLDITFHTKEFNIGVERFVDDVLSIGINSIRKMLETISILHIICEIDCEE